MTRPWSRRPRTPCPRAFRDGQNLRAGTTSTALVCSRARLWSPRFDKLSAGSPARGRGAGGEGELAYSNARTPVVAHTFCPPLKPPPFNGFHLRWDGLLDARGKCAGEAGFRQSASERPARSSAIQNLKSKMVSYQLISLATRDLWEYKKPPCASTARRSSSPTSTPVAARSPRPKICWSPARSSRPASCSTWSAWIVWSSAAGAG